MTQPGQVVFSKMEEVRLRQAGRRDGRRRWRSAAAPSACS